MTRILGLDLGTNSIGWAVVDKEKNQFSLIDKGVRIFQEGVKIEKGIESSKAADRTKYRSSRRIKFRRKLRKIQTLKTLVEFGYCPGIDIEELNIWRYKKVYPQNEQFRDWWKTDDEHNINPYFFRNLVVTEKLDLTKTENRFKIGRAFYHISQRRGFLSNRLENTKESDGLVKSSIEEISLAKGDLTLGQYFYKKYISSEKIRDTYTHREEHYLEEFERICNFQGLPIEFVDKLRKSIFYQRPLKSQKGAIGKCVFEKKKARCAVSHPLFEEYRMLCFVNNIKIKTPNDEKLRFLNKVERAKAIERFFLKREHFDFEDIVKYLAPKKQYKFYKDRNINQEDYLFNYSMNTTVSGCPVLARFKDLFGETFIDERYNIIVSDHGDVAKNVQDAWHVLLTFNSEIKLKEFAINKLGLNDEQVSEFVKIKLKQDYASLSLKAIKNILPFLREGIIYSHAVFIANMKSALPKTLWIQPENQKEISDQIKIIINTQKDEKDLVEIVNGIIKTCRENGECWSNEAEIYFKQDLIKRLEGFYGKNKFNSFSEKFKTDVEDKSFRLLKKQMLLNNSRGEFAKVETIDERLKHYIIDTFKVGAENLSKIYHPSAIEIYKQPIRSEDGNIYLGSPMVSAVRNPMAMRALHQLRKVINELIKNEVVDQNTKINIEMARDLMNSNERKAYQNWQRDRENLRKTYSDRIKEYYRSQNINLEPSEDDILKYQLWEEQKHKCLYTGKEILLSGFLGANPKFDIEHTIPRSLSLDNSQANKTLCDNVFNRSVKKNRIPSELENHKEILSKIVDWRKKVEDLEEDISKAVRQSKNAADKDGKDRAIQKRHKLSYERDYWRNKYKRFEMEDVPDGFKNSQIVDTGIITRYARMYLNTIFDKVYTVKGNTVADFRKIWGLQEEYVKKERINHIHHCVDAITIACITKENYENLAKFYHEWEELEHAGVKTKPVFEKPWRTFTEDLKTIENEVLISHNTSDVLLKQTKKIKRKRGIIQRNADGKVEFEKGNTARGSLHLETFYGAIERPIIDENGKEERQIKYVLRKSILKLKLNEVDKIVDEIVKEKVKNSIADNTLIITSGENQQNILSNTIWMNEEKRIQIKKVRIYQAAVTNPIKLKKNRDKTVKQRKEYKEYVNVLNEENYALGVYEAIVKDKVKKRFEALSNFKASSALEFKIDKGLFKSKILFEQSKIINGREYKLKNIIKVGNLVILYENFPEEIWDLDLDTLSKRLYKVYGFRGDDGRVKLRHHQEARPDKDQDKAVSQIDFNKSNSKLIISLGNLKCLVEGIDFVMSVTGKIEQKNINIC